MYPSVSFSIIMFKKKHLNSTISCFRFQKNYTTPRGGCNLQGRYKRFSEHGLLSYRLLRWSNSTLCQSSGGCQAPGAFQGQGARLHGLKIPMSGWSEKLMGWWWGDGILRLPLTKTNSNVHTGIVHMIKTYIYYIYDIYIYTSSCVCTKIEIYIWICSFTQIYIWINVFVHLLSDSMQPV